MTATTTATKGEISFESQVNGYDPEQVDNYIARLSDAYQQVYEEYTLVRAEHSSLLEKYKQQEAKKKNGPDSDIIAKVLVDAQGLAQKILLAANEEADKIRADAETDAKAIAENAYIEKAKAMIKAGKVLEEADAEIARVNERREQTNEVIRQIIAKMQDLLAADILQTKILPEQAASVKTA